VSGTNVDTEHDDALERLEAVLDRQVTMEPLAALTQAVNDHAEQQVDLGKVALGFDSSVFMRLATGRRSADILDYLPRHNAPLILPGQAIQEFWNNRLSVVLTVSTSLKRNFNQLATDVAKVDTRFGDFEEKMTAMLDSFDSQFGYIYDENTKNSVAKMLAILQDRASCTFVPRIRFSRIAELRKQTRTPPGFKDDGYGDFFLWADFLFGLLMCKSAGSESDFEKVVLLTNDSKPDWSTHGTPHPILSAEVYSLFNKPFDLWDLDTFVTEVERVL
jgi:hypothetical protein